MEASDQPGLVVGASWPTLPEEAPNPSAANAVGIGSTFVGHFMPTDGSSFAAMTTGNVELAQPPNDSSGAGADNGTSARNVNDLSILKIDVNVPASDNCLAFDGVFYSDEYPEYVGSQFNDAFVAELDSNSWSYDPSTNALTAPNNFAFDEEGNQITVNSAKFAAEGETGLQYDGSTKLLTASTPVTPGSHSIYLSIYDAGDHIYDSAAFIDHLRTLNASPSECAAGAKLADSDGDGLPDVWEEHGVTDHDGTMLVDLPAMGASPDHKDIFVQLDAMEGLQLDPGGLALVEKAFNDAPVDNPDGTTGIHLHVDSGPDSTMNQATHQKWGSLSQAHSSLPFSDVLGGSSAGQYDWSAFDAVKAENLPTGREGVFHYAISANRFLPGSTRSGISRGAPSSDFLVTLGSWCHPVGSCPGPLLAQAGTFMHELGHNLGLHHGGAVDTENVPNYLSVMNYTFQTTGLDTAPDIVDYSRFNSSTVPDLDETELFEPGGFETFGLSLAAGDETLIRCAGGLFSSPHWNVVSMSGPVDFNCNGSNSQPSVDADLNGDGSEGTLSSYDDWENLQYKGGAIGGDALGSLLPEETPAEEEATEAQLSEVADAIVPPPTAETGLPTSVSATDATLNAYGNPMGEDARVYIQYGPTASYGQETSSANIGAGHETQHYAAQVSGLAPGGVYHYQAVVETAQHLVYGDDRTFVTFQEGGSPVPADDQSAAAAARPTAVRPKCRHGFKKQKVHGKAKCVKVKHHHKKHKKRK